MGLVVHCPLIYVEIKLGWGGGRSVKIHQYSMPLEAKKGITPHIKYLLDLGILWPVQYTPLLLLKSLINDYRPVQDLREINKRVMDIYQMMSNHTPYLAPYLLIGSGIQF